MKTVHKSRGMEMKVQKISAGSYSINTGIKYNNIEQKKESLPKGNNINLVSPMAYYNQISFKSEKVGNTMPELIRYMKETVEPFIKENDPLFKKASDISKEIHRAVRNFKPEKVEFNPFEFREVKRLRIDELYQNKKEFYYLLDKSYNYYSTKETGDYALGLGDYFNVPLFLREPYNAFCKMKKDTEKGLQNINLNYLYPELAQKSSNIDDIAVRAELGYSGYTGAYLWNKKFNEMLEKGIINIDEYKRLAQEAEHSMELHQKILPELKEAADKADSLYKNGLFTEADYELSNSIPKRAQQVISRNAKIFNDIAAETQLSENESKQLDDILKYQKELIKDLWNKIEADKKAYFEREAIAKAEWEAKARAETEKLYAEYGDDLPPF